MMRLGRRATLLVAFSLLTSTATAYTECAWVLWESHENRWKLRRALPDHKTCVAALDDEVRTVKRMGDSVSRDDLGSAVYNMKISGSIGLNCIPDTVGE